MEQSSPDKRLRFGRNVPLSIATVGICAVLTVVGWYGVQIEPVSVASHRLHSASFLILPVSALLTCLTFFWLFVPFGALVIVTPQGVTDRRVNAQMIPWDQITNVARKGDYVSLTLKRSFTPKFRMSLVQRALKSRRKSAGPNHVLISTQTLKVTSTDLAQVITDAYARSRSAKTA